MSATELKQQIINRVTAMTDESTLEEIYKLVNLEFEMESVYKLTENERSAIEMGFNDVKDGRVYTSEAAQGLMWKSLTEEQKMEVLKSYEESESDANLVEDKDVWKNLVS